MVKFIIYAVLLQFQTCSNLHVFFSAKNFKTNKKLLFPTLNLGGSLSPIPPSVVNVSIWHSPPLPFNSVCQHLTLPTVRSLALVCRSAGSIGLKERYFTQSHSWAQSCHPYWKAKSQPFPAISSRYKAIPGYARLFPATPGHSVPFRSIPCYSTPDV